MDIFPIESNAKRYRLDHALERGENLPKEIASFVEVNGPCKVRPSHILRDNENGWRIDYFFGCVDDPIYDIAMARRLISDVGSGDYLPLARLANGDFLSVQVSVSSSAFGFIYVVDLEGREDPDFVCKCWEELIGCIGELRLEGIQSWRQETRHFKGDLDGLLVWLGQFSGRDTVEIRDQFGFNLLQVLAAQDIDLSRVGISYEIIKQCPGLMISAAKNRSFNSMNALLDMEYNVNEQENGSGRTALHYLCELSDYQAVKMLVMRGANVEAKNISGKLPSDMAKGRNKDLVLKALGVG